MVPADRLLLAVQGSDDACAPLAWQPTNGVEELTAELVLYGVTGAACETGLSVLAVAKRSRPTPRRRRSRSRSAGAAGRVDAGQKAGYIGTIRAFA